MCGICMILHVPIQKHYFEKDFDFFSAYNPNNQQQRLPLNKHIIQNKLMLSNSFNLQNISKFIGNRGPDYLQIKQIDLYKSKSYKNEFNLKQQIQYKVSEGKCLTIQSTLHLRGNQIYIPKDQQSCFLYNGEIWNTGNLPEIKKGQNDAQWIHNILLSCKGNQQQILQTFRQIRGDYAIVFIQNNNIFIMKDYFGKRSLLVGMNQDHLIITSAPIQTNKGQQKQQKQQQNNDDEQKQTSWKQKYQAEWLSSKNKQFFQIPNNSLIKILLHNNQAIWSHFPIHNFQLRTIQKIKDQTLQEIMANCQKLLFQSVRQITKCLKDVDFQQNKQINKKQKQGTNIAILFSGGIDSTLIACILDKLLPKQQKIDLINLSFRQDAPDRESGLISYQQLKNISPYRQFNLILLDKTLNDIQQIKQSLKQTIYPKTTHMDFNIASALHIASKQTSAKVILTGLGADQIFSGYSRYRIAFKRAGFDQTESQMLFDMERLWIRNLGRDDRAIGMNGKQVRYPFLYLPLWKYLRTIQLNQITEGTGQKKLLRKIAFQMGLLKASTFKKKAIQFGTRLAKLSNVKCFGSNRKAKGTYEYK